LGDPTPLGGLIWAGLLPLAWNFSWTLVRAVGSMLGKADSHYSSRPIILKINEWRGFLAYDLTRFPEGSGVVAAYKETPSSYLGFRRGRATSSEFRGREDSVSGLGDESYELALVSKVRTRSSRFSQ
jgi:hypothetical protein